MSSTNLGSMLISARAALLVLAINIYTIYVGEFFLDGRGPICLEKKKNFYLFVNLLYMASSAGL